MIKQFRNGKPIEYQYKAGGTICLSVSNNISGYIFSGKVDNFIKPYLKSLKHLNNNVSRLNEYCFDGCENLISIDLNGTSITSLGDYCFQNCKNLETVIYAENLTAIPQSCFRNDTSLKFIGLREWEIDDE